MGKSACLRAKLSAASIRMTRTESASKLAPAVGGNKSRTGPSIRFAAGSTSTILAKARAPFAIAARCKRAHTSPSIDIQSMYNGLPAQVILTLSLIKQDRRSSPEAWRPNTSGSSIKNLADGATSTSRRRCRRE